MSGEGGDGSGALVNQGSPGAAGSSAAGGANPAQLSGGDNDPVPAVDNAATLEATGTEGM
jgi:hypothetical protein